MSAQSERHTSATTEDPKGLERWRYESKGSTLYKPWKPLVKLLFGHFQFWSAGDEDSGPMNSKWLWSWVRSTAHALFGFTMNPGGGADTHSTCRCIDHHENRGQPVNRIWSDDFLLWPGEILLESIICTSHTDDFLCQEQKALQISLTIGTKSSIASEKSGKNQGLALKIHSSSFVSDPKVPFLV